MAAKPVSGAIPNLVNGVSQQSPSLRLPSQAELQENYFSTIVEGLKDRPPTEFVAKLLDSLPSNVFTHVINRDANERYIVLCDGSDIRVWDFDGNEKTVNAPNGYGYLSGASTPKTDLLALTVADYTFVVNKNQTVTADAGDTAPTRNPEALVNVLEGNYAKTYRIAINGSTAASFTTSATDASTLDTTNIAAELYNDLDAGGFNDGVVWSSTRYQNAIHIERLDGTDFTVTIEDGFNGNAMKVVKGRTQHFSDLPYFGPDGFVAEIIGDNSTQFDNYWVKLETAGGTAIWRETVKPGVILSLDATTMPHTLVRESDGTFTFDVVEWDQRKCGDTDISPDPSFVGHGINDVFFHRDRLGFLSDQNAILSRTGSFFDFFRTSATALLDDDPIDVGASHNKVSILLHAVPYQKELLVFSDQTQFLLAGNNNSLTPKNVSMDPLTEYVSDTSVAPIGLGLSVFFAAKREEWASVWEYVIDTSAGSPVGDGKEVTDDVPSYIPSNLTKIAGTSNESVLVGITDGDPDTLYVYKFYYQQQKKLQSAWEKFVLPGATILNVEFVDSVAYLVLARSDGVYLEKMRLQSAVADDDLGFLIHLDQRVHTDQLAAPSYDSGADQTTYTLPYAVTSDIVAVTAPGNENVLPALQLNVDSTTASTVTLPGDTQDYPIFFGYTYTRRYRFSEFFLRQPNGSGGTISVQNGRLQIKKLTLAYDKTAYFTVEVTPQGRATRTYVFTGRTLGSDDNVLGVVPITSGKKTIPVLSRSDRVVIDIVNDSWMPSSFINATWVGTHSPNARSF